MRGTACRLAGRVTWLAGVAGMALIAPGLAAAQSATTPQGPTQEPPRSSDVGPVPAPDEGPSSGAEVGTPQDVVVTGTLVRGIAPVGTSVINVDRADVIASGARSSIEVLADVPQVSNFFNNVNVPGTNFGQPANRPLIRGLPTLLLLNGYRVVGTGVIQTSPEPNQIAPGSIERVEVIPGSGSSVYGSDAVGGVINFITRRRVEGVEATARYGFGEGFRTQDVQGTVGHAWTGGSAFVSYAYAHHGELLNSQRSYYTTDLRRYGGTDFRINTCPLGNVVANGVNYALPSFAPGTNLCDADVNADFYPRETRHNVLAGISQQLSPSITFDMTAYFSRRTTWTKTAAPTTANLGIDATNPYFRSVAGETSQQVSFSFYPVYGPTLTVGRFDSWGVTPQFAIKVGGDWEVKVGANYGHSFNSNVGPATGLNADALAAAAAGTTTATALNPYTVTATNPAVLASIFNYANIGITKQDLYQLRSVADGTVFRIGGNDAKAAVGVEYNANHVDPSLALGPVGTVPNTTHSQRDVKSIFGELVVPFVGMGNAVAGIRALTLSGSVRYDRYSDFGDTVNPKIAATYEPVEGLSIIGNWGTNFHAPELTDTANTVDGRNQFLPVSPFTRPGDPPFVPRPTILLAGGNPNLQPEKSTTWSAGAEYKLRFVPGLTLGATYFQTRFRDRIYLVLPFPASNLSNPAIQSFFHYNPTLAEARTLLAGRINDGFTTVDALYANPATQPYLILDARRANLGRVNLSGVDFHANYNHDIGGVAISAGVDGTYLTQSDQQQVPNSPFASDLANGTPRLSFSAFLGGKLGPLAGRATLFDTGSFPVQNIVGQTRVGDFKVVNLFLSYDLSSLGLKATTFTVNVDNVGDAIPPFYNSGAGRSGSTLGRLVTIGVSTRF